MKTFGQFITESEAATNVTGSAIANKDNPLGKKDKKTINDKDSVETRKLNEAENEDKAFNYQYSRGKWAGYAEFKVDRDLYKKIRLGKDKYSSWDAFMPPSELQRSIRNVLYKSGAAILTSDEENGASVILRHNRLKRQAANDDLILSSESFSDVSILPFDILNECEECDFSCDDSAESHDAYDYIYDAAYDYALDELGYSEDDSDLFGDLVTGFIWMFYHNDEPEGIETDMDALYDQAVRLLTQASVDDRLPVPTEDIIYDAKEYILDWFDIAESGDIDDI